MQINIDMTTHEKVDTIIRQSEKIPSAFIGNTLCVYEYKTLNACLETHKYIATFHKTALQAGQIKVNNIHWTQQQYQWLHTYTYTMVTVYASRDSDETLLMGIPFETKLRIAENFQDYYCWWIVLSKNRPGRNILLGHSTLDNGNSFGFNRLFEKPEEFDYYRLCFLLQIHERKNSSV